MNTTANSLTSIIGRFTVPADQDNMIYERHADGSVSGVDVTTGNKMEAMDENNAAVAFFGAELLLA